MNNRTTALQTFVRAIRILKHETPGVIRIEFEMPCGIFEVILRDLGVKPITWDLSPRRTTCDVEEAAFFGALDREGLEHKFYRTQPIRTVPLPGIGIVQVTSPLALMGARRYIHPWVPRD